MSCPWSAYKPATLSFCEEPLCALISQPANTWTNVGFLVVGAAILRKEYRRNFLLSLIGFSCFFVGIGSTLFHMSGTFIFEVVDVFGMFLISSLMVSLNLWRLWQHRLKLIVTLYFLLNIISLFLLVKFESVGIALFATQIYAAMSLEALLYLREDGSNYSSLWKMIVAFTASFSFWILDITKIVCIPDNHLLTGHGVWHLLNAIALYYMYLFYSQCFSDV